MAAVTYATRILGVVFAERLALTGRAKAAFSEIPAAVLVAVIAPTILLTGTAEKIAALVTAAAAPRLPLLATIAIGVVTVVVMRNVFGQ